MIMTLKKLVLLLVITLFSNVLTAQNSSENKAVEKAVLNYIENFFENNFDVMNESLHPRLAKRGLNPDGTMSDDLPPQKLKEILIKKKAFPIAGQKNKIENVQVFGKMASATLRTGYPNMKWVEYCHLVKENEKWKIINIFWDYYPMEKREKKQKKQ